ncbi:SnoaL-like domain-containing protein [Actinoplanes sp. TBRC 11911]|uniref:nuclear transport factor 2 family protein n=1 Tax=Actinoplanes sp. TBRC 11911 TaxID=2729386 RepID=UPI00145EE6F1|nr:nuclear transport factor 2 family protein [Actinoplanes sp. TBRC 11911]NMO51659.1 SnoaL-like domain-containing protein [Actinoplanes sp. TBRC 11911]
MSTDNRQLISDLYKFAATGDFVRLGELMAPDYALVQSPGHPMAGTWEGAAATAAAGQFSQALGISGITVHDIATDGPHRVMSLVDLIGTDGAGRPWTMPLVECFRIENGRITEVRPFYWDQHELAAILASRGITEFRPTV